MKLSFSTLGCPDWSLETIAQKASEYGYDGVELRAKGRQHIDVDMSSEERTYIKKLFESKGIKICCVAGYSRFCSESSEDLEQNRKLLIDYVRLAADLGAPVVRTFIGQFKDNMTEDTVAANAARQLELAGDIAYRSGITIVVETHDQFSSGQKIRKLLDMIKTPGVAALWDIHHPYSSKESVQQTYDFLGNRVRHVHIKDAAKDNNGIDRLCLTGKGELPIGELVSLLESKGYSGYYSLEWEKMWHKELDEPEIAFPQFIKYMKNL